jgi:DNA-binding protein WhiA
LEETFGIVGFIVDIRYGYRLYVKNGEMINEFLNLSGATNSAKLFSSLMASKRIHSDVTRSMNFIEANSKRSGNASWKQIAAIIKVDKKIGLDSFPKEIQDAAALRLSNPELSLREIGNMLEPPVSKSIVHRRLMKILDEADKQI